MSRPAQGGPGQPEDKPHGFSRFIWRASKVLRRGSTNRSSVSGITDLRAGLSGNSPTALAAQPRSATPPNTDQSVMVEICPTIPAAISQSIRDINKSYNTTTSYRNASSLGVTSEMQQERARALFAKYGLTLGPADWTPPSRSNVERVEKPIRMRVHRQCHQCQTTFGRDKVCTSCHHIRCTNCLRYPARRIKKAPEVEKSSASAGPVAGPGSGTGLLVVDMNTQSKTSKVLLTMPGRTPGKELVRREPLQRVRRTCHKCESVFQGKGQACLNCNHERCSRCPRDPPKLNKYPQGYPGDDAERFSLAERCFKPQRTRFRYQCHYCSAAFKEQESICGSCDHERCSECARYPPKTIKVPPVDSLMDSVSQKLGMVDITSQAAVV